MKNNDKDKAIVYCCGLYCFHVSIMFTKLLYYRCDGIIGIIALSCVPAASNLINSFITYLGWSVDATQASRSPAGRLPGGLRLGHRPVLAGPTTRRAASPAFRPRQPTVGDIGRIGGV